MLFSKGAAANHRSRAAKIHMAIHIVSTSLECKFESFHNVKGTAYAKVFVVASLQNPTRIRKGRGIEAVEKTRLRPLGTRLQHSHFPTAPATG